MLRKNYILLALLISGVMSACASQPADQPLDTAELAREIVDEERQKAIETATPNAPQADTSDVPPQAPLPPIWETTADKKGLQHKISGLICPAVLAGFKMTGEESFEGLGHGNDVACVYAALDGGVVKLHLTNFGRAVSPAAHLKGVETTVKDTFKVLGTANVPALPKTQPESQPNRAPINNAAAYRLAAVSDLRPDIPVHTGIWIEQIGAWHVKIRATYEADRAPAIAALVDTLYANARNTIRQPDRVQLPEGIEN